MAWFSGRNLSILVDVGENKWDGSDGNERVGGVNTDEAIGSHVCLLTWIVYSTCSISPPRCVSASALAVATTANTC